MEKVSIYPNNKVTQGLIRFRELLNIEIKSVIDFVFDVGKDAQEILDGEKSGIMIMNEVDEALEGVDTLLLNEEGTPLAHFQDFYFENELDKKWRLVVETAFNKGKKIISSHNIYSKKTLDWLSEKKIKIDFPEPIEKENIEKKYFENLKNDYKTKNMTRIGIYGTRSCIGKFTTQQMLFKELRKKRKVKTIITEPTAFLFKDTYPLYSTIPLSQYENTAYLRKLVEEEDKNETEYFIFSDQGSVVLDFGLGWYMTKLSYLKGFHPDKVIIIADYRDDEVLEKMITFFKVFSNIDKPMAVLIPDRVEKEYGIYEKKTEEEMKQRKKEIKEKFNISTVEIIRDIDKVAQTILN
ncbi:DUF1611 domain-containing protein [Haliovirga abyssi]|uniref:D-glutamate N-acetyltransferase-like C-terminal domain-containing protein n=1 Tax=Haliovirga abyssi TaxID=2996794 RepID=A0AAU9DI56_9FUSO|nr:DUF1611 domain-containing protein [Haliovirga abyssi]BDU49452.1 hypothetical protein HLVA_00210 [Haliovirga abyssi]